MLTDKDNTRNSIIPAFGTAVHSLLYRDYRQLHGNGDGGMG